MINKDKELSGSMLICIKIFLLAVILIIFEFPLQKITELTKERKTNSYKVMKEISNTYGGEQVVSGPLIALSYYEHFLDKNKRWDKRIKRVYFTSKELNINAEVQTHLRHRGIYKIPVYDLNAELNGYFNFPDISRFGIKLKDVIWEKSSVSIDLTDIRGLADKPVVLWDGLVHEMTSGDSSSHIYSQAVFFTLPKMLESRKYDYKISLKLRGGKNLNFLPLADTTKVSVISDWKSKSFNGAYTTKNSNKSPGTEAEWLVTSIGRNFPSMWEEGSLKINAVKDSKFGFDLFQSVNHYLKSERTVKYGLLFILLPFLCLFLFEVFSKNRIHLFQYVIVGIVECLFFLLQLSLAEHIGFIPAFILSSSVTILLITYYAFNFIKGRINVLFLTFILLVAYLFLFIVIQNEDYALLLGSIGLFFIIMIVIIVTRKINWYEIGKVLPGSDSAVDKEKTKAAE